MPFTGEPRMIRSYPESSPIVLIGMAWAVSPRSSSSFAIRFAISSVVPVFEI
jgi:hypothetical protein